MPRLFISHSARDNAAALGFQNWLVANGWMREDVFIDLHSIGAGERWRDTLRKANAACEAVILLASPEALASKECQLEMSLAEDYGKEIIVAILRDLTKDDPRLARYSERQFVDLSAEPKDRLEPFEFEERVWRIEFSGEALARIKSRLGDLGIAPGSFAWPPRDKPHAEPYPGLAAFGEEDAGIFFGREADIMAGLTEVRMVRRRRTPRLFVIDAASGAGKSSFLRAGLWPRLKRDPDFAPIGILRPAQGILTGPDGCGRRIAPYFERHGKPRAPGTIHASLTGGDAAAGAQALAALLTEATELATVARRAAAPDARPPAPLIAIDQGEELFAAENEAESARFFAMLASVLKAPPEGVDPYILFTIRADSVESLMSRVAELGLDTPKVIYLPPLSRAAYRDVILKPAEVYSDKVKRLVIDPALADVMVNDAMGADATPLLAFTLQRLFADFHAEGQLTLSHYEAMEGIGGSIKQALKIALVKAGNAGTLDNLHRLIVPRLATWDPEADQGKGAAKRVVAALDSVIGGDRKGLEPLANALVSARLLLRSRDTLEVAHEALLRQSPIIDWLEDNREFLVWRDRLARERASFEANQRGPLMGRELQIARDWVQRRDKDDIAADDRQFVEHSVREDERRRNEEEQRERQRQAAELDAARTRELAAAQAATAARRLARNTAFGLAGALTFAVAAAGAGGWAYLQRQEALDKAEQAREMQEHAQRATNEAVAAQKHAEDMQSRLIASHANEAVAKGDAAAGIALALETLPDASSTDLQTKSRPWRPEAARALSNALLNLRDILRIDGHTGPLNAVALSRDGTRIVSGGNDNSLRVWDAASGVELRTLTGHTGDVRGLAFIGDSSRVVSASTDNSLRIWDSATGELIRKLDGHSNGIYGVDVSRDGTRIVSGSWDDEVRIWDAATGAELRRLTGHTNDVNCVAFSRDGKLIVSGADDSTVRIWDAATGAEIAKLEGHKNNVYGCAFSPDGKQIVSGAGDNTVRVWDVEKKSELRTIDVGSSVQSVAFMPDGTRIVAAAKDVGIWDAGTGASLVRIDGHTSPVQAVVVSEQGDRLVSASDDQTVRVWSGSAGPELSKLEGHTDSIFGVAISADGSRVITSSGDRSVRVWDSRSGRSMMRLTADGSGSFYRVAANPSATLVISGSEDSTARVWSTTTGNLVHTLKGHTARVYGVGLTTDGSRIVTASGDNNAKIWDGQTGAELLTLTGHTAGLEGAAITPDGSLVVTGSSDDTARVWDGKTGAMLLELRGHTGDVRGVAITPSGHRVATGSSDGTAKIWDGKSGKVLRDIRAPEAWGVAISDDGSRLVVGSADRARVFDVETGSELASLPGVDGHGYNVAMTPDGTRVAGSNANNTGRVWRLTPSGQQLVAAAKEAVPRCLSPAERRRYSLQGLPPRWCAGLGKWPYSSAAAVSYARGAIDSNRTEEIDDLAVALQAHDAGALAKFNEAVVQILLDRANASLKDRKFGDALVRLDYVLQRDPSQSATVGKLRVDALVGQVEALLTEGKDTEAQGQFERALKLDPKLAERADELWGRALVKRGEKLIEEGKETEAQAQFELALKRNRALAPDVDKAIAAASLKRGEKLLEGGKAEEAQALFAKALKLNPALAPEIEKASTEVTLKLGQKLMEEGKIAEAQTQFDAVLKRNPDMAVAIDDRKAGALGTIGKRHRSAGKFDEARATFNELRELRTADPRARAELLDGIAWDWYAAGRAADGLDDAERAVALDANHGSSRDSRAHIYMTLGRHAEALADFNVAIEKGFKTVSTYYSRGHLHDLAGRREQAMADFREALKQSGTGEIEETAKRKAKERLDELERAAPGERPAPAGAGGDASAMVDRGVKLLEDGSAAAAQEQFDLALKLQPDLAVVIDRRAGEAALRRGRKLREDKKYAEALALFDAALQRNPGLATEAAEEKATALDALVSTSRDEGKLEDARTYARQLRELPAPDPKKRADMLDGLAWEWHTAGRAADGLDDVERAIALDPDNASAHDTRGHIYLALGRNREAMADFDLAIGKGYKSVSAYYSRGHLRDLAGRREEAMADFRLALKETGTGDIDEAAKRKAKERLDELERLAASARPAAGGAAAGGGIDAAKK